MKECEKGEKEDKGGGGRGGEGNHSQLAAYLVRLTEKIVLFLQR